MMNVSFNEEEIKSGLTLTIGADAFVGHMRIEREGSKIEMKKKILIFCNVLVKKLFNYLSPL